MSPLQESILAIYKVFREICLNNDLTYYAIGGTSIGAVRHHGFIPWDDDLDVCMPIEDMMSLIEICKRELPERYEVKSYFTDDHYPLALIKIVDKETTQIEYTFQHVPEFYSGVWLDIFPLSSTPVDEKGRQKFVQRIVKNVEKIHFYAKRQFYMGVSDLMKERISWGIAGTLLVPFRSICNSRHFAHKVLEDMMGYPFYDNQSPYKYGLDIGLLPNEWLSGSVDFEFEDTIMPLFSGYHEELTRYYGDYMSPPKQQDIYHHYCFTDLEHPYKDYACGLRTFEKRSN